MTDDLYMKVPFRVIATAECRVTYIKGDVGKWRDEQSPEWRATHQIGGATEVSEEEYKLFLDAIVKGRTMQ